MSKPASIRSSPFLPPTPRHHLASVPRATPAHSVFLTNPEQRHKLPEFTGQCFRAQGTNPRANAGFHEELRIWGEKQRQWEWEMFTSARSHHGKVEWPTGLDDDGNFTSPSATELARLRRPDFVLYKPVTLTVEKKPATDGPHRSRRDRGTSDHAGPT